MGQIVALTNQKGGVGKSTAAVHLSGWLHQRGSVALVDCDSQQSSSRWIEKLALDLPCYALDDPNEILEQLPAIAAAADYCVVDGPAGLSEATRAILFRADLAIVPTQPSGLDLASTSAVLRLCQQAQSVRNGPPAIAVFISRAVPNTRLKQEAIDFLRQKTAATLLETVIHQRQPIADAFSQGRLVWHLSGGRKSGIEYEQLFAEISQLLL